uniref:NADH-ubiquinone oxidoreductase chain 1 n=1 Tax=Pimpla luctuosa TaxID=495389 RepID=A0A3Q8UAA7_9HYME|nr:NADH dehydrogenase subunit 1 [Pimpla luctuosa]
MKQINIYMYMSMIILILVVIMILISVAFLTLMERKLLGYIQIRKGPNKLGFMGLLQPFSDAIKLLSKEDFIMYKLNYLYYYISPIYSLILTLMMWMIYPFLSNLMMLNYGMIYLMCCLGLGGYGLLIAGWSSNSSYAMLGSLRSLAQSISYEVSLVIIMISSLLLINSFNLNNFNLFQEKCWMVMFMWPISMMFFFSIMAELNRTPFDFSEGESELVSGFNVEYSSGSFVLIFLSEYSSILFMSFLYILFYVGSKYEFYFYLNIMLLSFLILWIRGTLPRFRYDLLMYFCWLMILPFSLNYMMFMLMFKILILK